MTGTSVVVARDIWDVLDRVQFPGTGQFGSKELTVIISSILIAATHGCCPLVGTRSHYIPKGLL